MKTRFLLPAWMAIALACSLNVTAYGHEDDDGDRECDRDGHESMNAVIELIATTNAPAGARGVARLEAGHDDGEAEAELGLKLVGLPFGDYLLSVTRSDGTNVVLGQLTIGHHRHRDDGDDDDQGEDEDGHHDWGDRWEDALHWIRCNWGGFTNWGSWTNWSITNWCNASNRATAVEAEVDLPSSLNPADIAQIVLSDTNGVPLLVGDLVKPAATSVINISASLRVAAGPAAPAATGQAQLRSTAVRGKWKHQFTLAASGLDARSVFRVYVNNRKAGGTKSNRNGEATMRKIPSRTPAVRSVELLDASGNVAARVRF